VVAAVFAEAHERSGGPMRDPVRSS
jgi:hypothetical protein